MHTRDDKNIYENRLNEEGKYSQENPHAAEKITQQRAKEFSQEIKEQMKNSIDKTVYLMNKRNAPQVDKNYLFDLSSAINKKTRNLYQNQEPLNSQDSKYSQEKAVSLKRKILYQTLLSFNYDKNRFYRTKNQFLLKSIMH